MRQDYVAGFMFSLDFKNVVLIQKEKPQWQKGKFNAIGGKMEKGEKPKEAMVREFEEETGIKTDQNIWEFLCLIGDEVNYEVFFFYCAHEKWQDHESRTEEEVFDFPVKDLHLIKDSLIENLNWLIPLCLDKASGFSGYIRT